ncbi:MAG: DUF421 domain-containing protein [Pseudolabrys sp.]
MDAIANAFDPLLGLSAVRAEQLTTLQVCIRAAVVYLVLIAYVRIGKKRFLGEATAFDAILVIIIASISILCFSGTETFLPPIAWTLTLIMMHWLISWVTRSSPRLSYWTKGYDTVLIRKGTIDRAALRGSHMSDDDLSEDLRQNGIASVAEVEEARLERSGKLSVIRARKP